MKTKNKKIIIVTGISFICCLCCIMSMTFSEDRLDVTQIESLRNQYPVCGIDAPAGLTVKRMDVIEVKDKAESFVFGEVVGEVMKYNVTTSLSNEMLSEKRNKNGIKEVFEFYEYAIEVIEDTEGKYRKGDLITITANMDFINYNPSLSDGMRVVVPVAKDKKKSSRNHYIVDGMYYVTPEGYALSAFDEEKVSVARGVSSGVKVETLLKNLKK